MRKKIVVVGVVATVIFIVLIGYRIMVSLPPNLARIEKKLEQYKQDIEQIVALFSDVPFKNAGIDANDLDFHFIKNYDTLPIQTYEYESEKVFTSLQSIFYKAKCQYIQKEESYILFQFWSNRKDGIGLAYSLSGVVPKINEAFTGAKYTFEPLFGKPNYFYFQGKSVE